MNESQVGIAKHALDGLRTASQCDLLTCYFHNPYSELYWIFHKIGDFDFESHVEGPITVLGVSSSRMRANKDDEAHIVVLEPHYYCDLLFVDHGKDQFSSLSQSFGHASFVQRERIKQTIRIRLYRCNGEGDSSQEVVIFLNYRDAHPWGNSEDPESRPIMARLIREWVSLFEHLFLDLSLQPRIREFDAWKVRSLQVNFAQKTGETFGHDAQAVSQELYSLIVQYAVRIINPGRNTLCTLSLIDADNKVRVQSYWPSTVSGAVKRPHHGIVDWSARTGNILYLRDICEYKMKFQQYSRGDIERSEVLPEYYSCHPNSQCELACPVLLGSKVIGVLNLEADTPSAYDDGHILLLHQFSTTVGLVARQASLWNTINTMLAQGVSLLRAESLESIFQTIKKTVVGLRFKTDLFDLTKNAWHGGRSDSTPCPRKDGFTMWIRDKKTPVAVTKIAVADDKVWSEVYVARNYGEHEQPISWDRATESDNLPQVIHAEFFLTRKSISTLLGFPILLGNEVKGVLWASSSRELNSLRDDEVWLASATCRFATLALEIRSHVPTT